MVSFGMLPALASRIALRKRAFASGSPPPLRAATVISLINLVNSLPRLASSAPFLCLILCHFECPDIGIDPSGNVGCQGRQYITGAGAANSGMEQQQEQRAGAGKKPAPVNCTCSCYFSCSYSFRA